MSSKSTPTPCIHVCRPTMSAESRLHFSKDSSCPPHNNCFRCLLGQLQAGIEYVHTFIEPLSLQGVQEVGVDVQDKASSSQKDTLFCPCGYEVVGAESLPVWYR